MKKIVDKYKVIRYIIILLAIIIRIIFINKSDIGLFQYDMGLYNYLTSEEKYDTVYTEFDEGKMAYSHINYIMYLYTYNSLPQLHSVSGQFYHPPLHHFIMATWLKIMDLFSDVSSFKLESMQYVTVFYSFIILIALYKILKEINVDEKYIIFPMILFAFYPLYIYLSGSINNDELVTMFNILAFLYLLKWNNKQSYKNAILMACFIGLGLMTKSSAIVMLIPAIYVYFKNINESWRENKRIKKLLIQAFLVGIIILILGGWFHVVSKFYTLTINPPKEEMRITTDSLWDRFGLTAIWKSNIYNVWNYLLYSSITFAIFSGENLIIKEMVILALILLIESLYYSFKFFKKNLILNITNFSWLLFYIYLQISLPYECSMHSRYMLLPISLLIIILGDGLKTEKNKIIKYQIIITIMTLAILSIKLFLGNWG